MQHDEPGTAQPPCPIERILIFHVSLPEKCLDGRSLGEDASIQELSEQILYYHHNMQRTNEIQKPQAGKPRTKVSLGEEAVQFLGLCTALYSLPSSLDEDTDLTDDYTQEIHFENSTLVFVPLESSTDIVAVVQITRQFQGSGQSGANPLAVKVAIERSHQLFCMLRGGGILRRVDDSLDMMGGLYRLLKKIRKGSTGSAKGHKPDISKDKYISKLKHDVRRLRRSLPIQMVRRDLDAHYKEFVSNMAIATARNGGAGRCIVENIPFPIAGMDNLPGHQSLASISDGAMMKTLVEEFNVVAEPDVSLVGVASFVDGFLLNTHISSVALESTIQGVQTIDSVELSVENQCLLMNYVASFDSRISPPQTPRSEGPFSDIPGSPKLHMKTLALAFQDSGEKASPFERRRNPEGHFIQPPPQSMLSAFEQVESILTADGTNVWTLGVHVPFEISIEGNTTQHLVPLKLATFTMKSHRYLLFLDLRSTNVDPKVLKQLSFRLTELVESSTDADEDEDTVLLAEFRPALVFQHEKGQEIVVVNRTRHKVMIWSDTAAAAVPSNAQSQKRGRNRFLGFGVKPEGRNRHDSASTRQTNEWVAIGLDSRHKMASHLHRDTILAFDDAIADIHRRKSEVRQGSSTRGSVEMCSRLPVGWVYAFSAGEEELYAFLDSSVYATIADVQMSVSRMKGELLTYS